MPPKNKNPLKDPRKVEEYKQKGENNILRHALGQQAADILIRRMAAQEVRIAKLERKHAKLQGEFKTMLGQTRDIRKEKMTKDMAVD